MANDDCVLTPISLKKCNLGQWKRMMLEISVNGKYTFMHVSSIRLTPTSP
jgi:hypothetical protein